MRALVERIPEELLRRTTIRKKRVSFKEEDEHLGLDQESGAWSQPVGDGEEENLSVQGAIQGAIQRAILQFEHHNESRTRGWQGDLERDSLCEA